MENEVTPVHGNSQYISYCILQMENLLSQYYTIHLPCTWYKCNRCHEYDVSIGNVVGIM